MDDYKTLDSYGIKEGNVIDACKYARGGGPPLVNSTYSSNINCMDKRGKIGEFYCYYIKGSNEGTVWGDGIYTDDSNIAKAAVLEGKWDKKYKFVLKLLKENLLMVAAQKME